MDNLTITPMILIIVGIAALFVGLLIGVLIAGLFYQDDKEAPNKHLKEAARIWFDRRDGRLVFQIGDDTYKSGTDLTLPERKRMSRLIIALNKWLEPGSLIPAKPEAAPEGEQGVQPVPPTAPLTYENLAAPDNPRFDAAGMITNALADVPRSELPVKSMVSQIDEILQAKLTEANMQKWAVRLADLTGKGMVVMVGMEQYEFVDEVPYERVRTIVQESVNEWERRAETGDLFE